MAGSVIQSTSTSPSEKRSTGASPKPWYQQFWPWFLIALPGAVVVAGFYTLFLANRYADDLVVDDYYKEGLAINRQIVRSEEAAQRGIGASVHTDGRQLDVHITGDVNLPQLRLKLSHPLEADRDVAFPLQRIEAGLYRVTLPEPLAGRWLWTIDSGDGSPWRIDGEQRF